MLPSPPSSTNGCVTRAAPKGNLEPHVSNLPRRRRPTQLPTPDSDTSDDILEDSSSVSSQSSRPQQKPLQHVLRAQSPPQSPPSSSSLSSSPFPRPMLHYQPPRQFHKLNTKGNLQPHSSNMPRRPRPVQVLPGSGIYCLSPPAEELDDSGIPEPEYRFKGDSRASTLARALFHLCASESEWHEGLVESVYMRLHDLGLVPLPWMGALRREGLQIVEKDIREMILGHLDGSNNTAS